MLRIYKVCLVVNNKQYQQSNRNPRWIQYPLGWECINKKNLYNGIKLRYTITEYDYKVIWYASQQTTFAMQTKEVYHDEKKVIVTLDASVSHSPPTPINAWISGMSRSIPTMTHGSSFEACFEIHNKNFEIFSDLYISLRRL